MKKEQTVREHIEATLASFDDVVFTDDVVSILVARCEAKGNSTLGFAHNVARNWAIDQRRAKIAAANTVVRTQLAKAKAVVDLATAKRHAKELAQATAEFDSLVATVHSKRTSMPDALRYMRLVCIEDKSDADCADVFPGTNRDQRYQWLKRARDFVLLLASDVLKSVLWKSIGTKRKAK